MTTTRPFGRQVHRAAARIHDHLTQDPRGFPWADLPQEAWEEALRVGGRLRYALTRGWHAAARSLLEDLTYVVRQASRELAQFESNLPQFVRPQHVSGPHEITADVLALSREFPEASVNLSENSLTVHTEPIELDGVPLGPFRIVLFWKDIGRRQPYHVIAEEPLAAAENADVTHPHILDQRLCEGKGAPPIQTALSEGRIFDFFVLVNQILHTYNASSAHVPLDRWSGVACHDCGCLMPSDDQQVCERCEAAVCDDCLSACAACGDALCSGCLSQCALCSQPFCGGCLTMPDGSDQLFCETCLELKTQQKDGHDTNSEHPPDGSLAEPAAETGAADVPVAANTLRLGEVDFSS